MEPTLAAPPTKPTLPAALAGVGGLIVAVAGFLTWFDLTSPTGSETIKGNDLSVGLAASAFGVFAAIAGVIVFFRGPQTGARSWSITAIVLGALLVILGGTSSFAPETALTEYAASDVGEGLGISETQAKAALESAFNAGTLEASAALGSFLVLGGGALALLGGIIGTARAKRMRGQTAPAATAAPPPTTSTPPPPEGPPPAQPAG